MKIIDRIKFFIIDFLNFLAVLLFISFIALGYYGIKTQCPSVAIYQYCGSVK